MDTSSIRVLIVDDYEPWRRFERLTVLANEQLQIVGECSDGDEAIQKLEELKPDLILLDISLPTLNGIEAARRIRQVSPNSKILFVSENRSPDIAEEALSTRAGGYVIKSNGASELLPAIKAVLEGRQFISSGLTGRASGTALNQQATAVTHRHELRFYADDVSVVDGYARFVEDALNGGNAVIVVVSESHRASLLQRLAADGVDVAAAVGRASYVPLDADDTMATLTVNDMPDPVRCEKVIADVVMRAANGIRREHARVMVCGEIAPTMLSKGNAEGTIQLEHLWDEITRHYGVHTHCGYVWNASRSKESTLIFERICAEHSAVFGRELGY
jgi:DNA-binding NarL/FixJ family response regulator